MFTCGDCQYARIYDQLTEIDDTDADGAAPHAHRLYRAESGVRMCGALLVEIGETVFYIPKDVFGAEIGVGNVVGLHDAGQDEALLQTKLLLNMELKNYEVFYEGLEQRVIDAVTAHGMTDQVFVSSFNHISMQEFKNLCPEMQTGLLYDKPYLDIDKYIERSNADNMHPRYMLLQYQPELVDLYHSRGMKVNTWTVNDEENIRDMISRGVDCIISNNADLLCQVAEDMCD